MSHDLEVDFEGAAKLAGEGHKVFVFINNASELEFVREALGAGDGISNIDILIARQIVFGDKVDLGNMAEEFRDSVIVCPHGRTSLKFAMALADRGIRAYSLRGGIEGLKARQ
jgi:rhodanese-related sulfurtransferase